MSIMSSLTNALSGAFSVFSRKPDDWRIEVNDLEFQNSRFHTLEIKSDPCHPGNLCICVKARNYRLLGRQGAKKYKIGQTENCINFYARPYVDESINLYDSVHGRLAQDPAARAVLETLNIRDTAIIDNIPPAALKTTLRRTAHTLFKQIIEENYATDAASSSFGNEITIISSAYICVGLWHNGRRLVYDTANNLAHGTALYHATNRIDLLQKSANSPESRRRLILTTQMS